MTKTLDENTPDGVTILIALGGATDAMTLKKKLMNTGYSTEDAQLAMQRSVNGRAPLVVIDNDLQYRLGDDLPQRCAELLSWRNNGHYTGYLIEAYGKKAEEDGRCNEGEGIRTVEYQAVKEALAKVAGVTR